MSLSKKIVTLIQKLQSVNDREAAGSSGPQDGGLEMTTFALLTFIPDSHLESPYDIQMFLPVWSSPRVYFWPSWVLDRLKPTRWVRLLVRKSPLKRPHWWFHMFQLIKDKSGIAVDHFQKHTDSFYMEPSVLVHFNLIRESTYNCRVSRLCFLPLNHVNAVLLLLFSGRVGNLKFQTLQTKVSLDFKTQSFKKI